MINYLIMCRSLTYAQRTAKALEKAGITGVIQRTPQNITTDGCGYCIKVSEKHLSDALVTLQNSDISHGKIFMMYSDGRYSEVQV